jgi:hypothetical protein
LAWMFVCCECCVKWSRCLCDELITRPEESYRLWCVVCDLETSWIRKPWPTGDCHAKNKHTSSAAVGKNMATCFTARNTDHIKYEDRLSVFLSFKLGNALVRTLKFLCSGVSWRSQKE